jgi:hypothetical protein
VLLLSDDGAAMAGANRPDLRRVAVRRDLRAIENPRAQIVRQFLGVRSIALADAKAARFALRSGALELYVQLQKKRLERERQAPKQTV